MKKINLNQEQLHKLKNDIQPVLDSSKTDIRDTLKDMYCGFYTDKTTDIGYVMADKVLSLVQEYNQNVAKAIQDPGGWLEDKLQTILNDRTTRVDRCNTIYQIRVGLTAAEISVADGQEAAENYRKAQMAKSFTAEEATVEMENQLKAELKEALWNNGVLVSALDSFSQNAAGETDIASAVIRYGEGAIRYKAVLVMQSYLQTGEGGYLQDVFPSDASLQDIAYSVCSAMDTISVAQAVESGDMKEADGTSIIRAIGMVFGLVIAGVISGAVGIAFAHLAGYGFFALLGGLVVSFAVGSALAEPLSDAGAILASGAETLVVLGTKFVVFSVKTLISGIQKLAGWIKGLVTSDHAYETAKHLYTEPVSQCSVTASPQIFMTDTTLA